MLGESPIFAPAFQYTQMDQVPVLVSLAIGLFVATNIDDIFVLLGFYADPKFKSRQIVLGQYLGITVLFSVSIVASLIALVVARTYVGILGLIPIAMGLKQLWELHQGSDADDDELESKTLTSGRNNILAVSAITIANGGDNISIYTPFFATRSILEIALVGMVFAVMTAMWLFISHWLVNHRAIGEPVRRCGYRVVPYVFVALGIFIICDAGTLGLLRSA